VYGSLKDEGTRTDFGEGGTGVEAYANLVVAAINSAADSNKVIAKIEAIQTGNGKGSYIHEDFDSGKRALSTNGVGTNPVFVNSAHYP
jgi:hypothetical protein